MLDVVTKTLEVGERNFDYVRRVDEEKKEKLIEKALHCKYLREEEGAADGRSWQWLGAGYLAKTTETFVFAAQEHALRIRLR